MAAISTTTVQLDDPAFNALRDEEGHLIPKYGVRAESADPASDMSASMADQAETSAAIMNYGFGLAPSTLAGEGYISSNDLMVWVAQHTKGLNQQLRDLMNGCEARNKLVEDLAHVKAQVTEAADASQTKVLAENMIAAYEGTPYADEVKAVLTPVINGAGDGDYGKDEVTAITGDLQGKIDALQKQDQLDMIAIQDLTGRIREQLQLVSNLFAAASQTSMAIVGNVGR